MIINSVIDILNEEFDCSIDTSYYGNINDWDCWWRGYYEPFHQFIESSGGRFIRRKLYSLKMAKKVCEDWASILLNEKTRITVDDEQSQLFLTGNEESGGLLQHSNFWTLANRLTEKSFALGTGAIVAKLDGMKLASDKIVPDAGTRIKFEYIPASGIIPLTTENGEITEAAFVSSKMIRGKEYAYVQIITRSDKGYKINNRYYLSESGSLKPSSLPPGTAEIVEFNTNIPPFVIISPNLENNIIGNQGLGLSIYANSIDNLMGVDLAYNNFNRDFKLGGKKVFMNTSLTRFDENGNIITPDDVAQQLFVSTDGDMSEGGVGRLIQEYNPELRVDENQNGIQAQLDYLSFKCGLGTKHYQFNSGSIVTATQYMGDKQELVQNAAKHYIPVQNALINLTKFILWAAKNLCAESVNPDANVTIQFEDSYIIDKESERLRDQQEVRDGLMKKWEYRVKWRGESEEDAKRILSESDTNDELMGFDE